LSSLDPSGPEFSAGNLNIVSKGVPGTSKPCLGTLKMILPTYKEDESVRDLKVDWSGRENFENEKRPKPYVGILPALTRKTTYVK